MLRPTSHYRFQDLEFWAGDGLVEIYDHRDGSNVQVLLRDWKDRIRALIEEYQDMIVCSDYHDERDARRVMIERMTYVYKVAKSRGDPADERDLAYAARHGTRRKKYVVMPGWGKGGMAARAIVLK